MPPSITKNYFYNTLLVLFNYIFYLMVFPYISRVLGPVNIGKINFANSVIGFFIILANFGVSTYGIKEIAKARDARTRLSRTFSELFYINLIFTVFSVLGYLLLFLFVEKIQREPVLFLILGIQIIMNPFLIDWFYGGLEDYKYITLRSVAFKVISVFLVFFLIRGRHDYLLFAVISVIALSGSNLLNIIRSRKYSSLVLKKLSLARHLPPLSSLFFSALIGGVFIYFDIVLLGFLGNDLSVGFYSICKSIMGTVIVFIGSLGTVLIPRLSYHFGKGNHKEYRALIGKSINFIYFLSFPIMIVFALLSREIMLVFGGAKFAAAAAGFRLITPHILFCSLAGLYCFQVLLPMNREKEIIIANIVGAFVNFTINFIFIPRYSYLAASVAIVVSDLSVLVMEIFLSRKYAAFPVFNRKSINYLAGSALILAVVLGIRSIVQDASWRLLTSAGAAVIIYGAFLAFRRDEVYLIIQAKLKAGFAGRK